MNANDIPTAAELRDASRTMIDRLTAERDALRAALEEVCECPVCDGHKVYTYECDSCLSGLGTCTCKPEPCWSCAGTGRDYHGSEKARQLLEAK